MGVPSLKSLSALCGTLDMEFCPGRRRDPAPADEERFRTGVETAVRALDIKAEDVGSEDLARMVVAVYNLIGKDGSVNAARVRELVRIVRGEHR